MLVAAAICPHPPVLVPELAVDAAPELESVRTACHRALDRLFTTSPELIVAVGGGPATAEFGPSAGGSFAGYGIDMRVGPAPAVLPPSLTVGRWLLERHGTDRNVGGATLAFASVAPAASTQSCLDLGANLGARRGRVGLLVLGDGSACRGSSGADSGADGRDASEYDGRIARALLIGDTGTLTDLDPSRSEELQVSGRAPWQTLAGAATDDRFGTELLAHTAPYGVGYLVASWVRPT